MGKLVVVLSREQEAGRLVHWAGLMARARKSDVVAVCLSTGTGEPETSEVPLDGDGPDGGLPAAAAAAIRRSRAFIEELAPAPGPDGPEGRDEPHIPAFELVRATTPDPVPVVKEQVRQHGADLLLLSAGEKAKAESPDGDTAIRLFREAPCITVLMRTGGDDAERGERILVPVNRGPNSAGTLRFAVGLAEAGDGIVTALFVQTQVGEDAEMIGTRVLARRVLRWLGASAARVESRVVLAKSVREGVAAASEGYDLVILGTSDEWIGRKMLFGTVPESTIHGPDGTSVAVLRPPVPLAARLRFRIRRLLASKVPQLERADRVALMDSLQGSSQWNFDFMFLICASTLIASLGLIANSIPVVIGAMLVAPLMTPLIGAGLSLVQGNPRFLGESLRLVLFGFLLALAVACLLGLVVSVLGGGASAEMHARAHPGLLDLGVAFFSGMAAAYALARPGLTEALPGVAISASLIPPVATAGIALVAGFAKLAAGAALLFVTNIIAIVLGATLSLYLVGVRTLHLHSRYTSWTPRAVLLLFLLGAAVAVGLCFWLAEVTGAQPTSG